MKTFLRSRSAVFSAIVGILLAGTGAVSGAYPAPKRLRRAGRFLGIHVDYHAGPDGTFVGPMAGLMSAIETGGAPPTDSADNLNTLRLVEAAYLSASENRSVALAGFLER